MEIELTFEQVEVIILSELKSNIKLLLDNYEHEEPVDTNILMSLINTLKYFDANFEEYLSEIQDYSFIIEHQAAE